MEIVLASASPRRAELLLALGLSFTVAPTAAAELPAPGEAPAEMACRLAMAKAQAAREACGQAIVIAADTLVVLDGAVLGKPRDSAQATAMLRALRGREHMVHTGLALCLKGQATLQLASSPVTMRAYDDEEIAAYVASGDPLDKAGAYACQHPSFHPVATFGDCYANVMGLPLCHLYRQLMQWGLVVPYTPLQACPWARKQGGCAWAPAILQADSAAWQHCGSM